MWTGPADLQAIARAYGIERFWSLERGAGGLLLANGTGTMLAAMDELPAVSWAVDLTGLRAGDLDGWLAFSVFAGRLCSHVVAVLVCFLDDPDPLRQLLARFDPDRLAVYGNAPLHEVQEEWPAFVDRARRLGTNSR